MVTKRYSVIENDFTFNLAHSFKDRKASFIEFEHAYRINGVFDIYKLGNTVYDFELKSFKKFATEEELKAYCECVFQNTPQDTFLKKGKTASQYKSIITKKRMAK
jgi:hypothetical protein